jgi:hypothetical protein
VTEAEQARTESLDRKAATLASFVSLIVPVSAALGARFIGDRLWLFGLFAIELALLTAAAAVALWVLLPKEHVGLGMSYLERFPNWSEIRKEPEQVQGEAMAGLIEAIAKERGINGDKARAIRLAYSLLLAGLVAAAFLGSILGIEEVWS